MNTASCEIIIPKPPVWRQTLKKILRIFQSSSSKVKTAFSKLRKMVIWSFPRNSLAAFRNMKKFLKNWTRSFFLKTFKYLSMDSKFYLESIFYLPNRGQLEPKKSKWLTFNTNDSLKKLFPPKCAELVVMTLVSDKLFPALFWQNLKSQISNSK